MSEFKVDFEWLVCDGGYEFIPEEKTHQGGTLLTNSTPAHLKAKNKNLRKVRPLEHFTSIYNALADSPETPEGFLVFTEKYGFLETQKYKKENFLTWLGHVRDIREIRDKWRERGAIIGEHLPADGVKITEVDTILTPSENGNVCISFRPKTLISAIRLQLIQDIVSGSDIESCKNCGSWFTRGPKGQRRGDAQTCSKKCQIEFNNKKRAKGGANG